MANVKFKVKNRFIAKCTIKFLCLLVDKLSYHIVKLNLKSLNFGVNSIFLKSDYRQRKNIIFIF